MPGRGGWGGLQMFLTSMSMLFLASGAFQKVGVVMCVVMLCQGHALRLEV